MAQRVPSSACLLRRGGIEGGITTSQDGGQMVTFYVEAADYWRSL